LKRSYADNDVPKRSFETRIGLWIPAKTLRE
jgi:hypothetical protein